MAKLELAAERVYWKVGAAIVHTYLFGYGEILYAHLLFVRTVEV